MANLAQLSRVAVIGSARIAAANNAGDGSGTVVSLGSIPYNVAIGANVSGNTITVPNWSNYSDEFIGRIGNGDRVTLLHGTGLTNLAINGVYYVAGISVSSSDEMTCYLTDSNGTIITWMDATNPVWGFDRGGRVELMEVMAAQPTKAGISNKVVTLYWRPRGGNYRKLRDVNYPGHTPSTTVVSQLIFATISQAFPSGTEFGATISVYAGEQDQTDVVLFGSAF